MVKIILDYEKIYLPIIGTFNSFAKILFFKDKTKSDHLISIYTFIESVVYNIFVILWLGFCAAFVYWWFSSTKLLNFWGYILTSISVLWLPFISAYFIFFSSRAKKLKKQYKLVPKGRLALITTKIPSESFDLIKRSLVAMLAQKYPYKYDVWLADEDPQKETIEWCKENRVKISTRKNNPDYHRNVHPRKAKTKEGNLAYFYDHWGYADYDYVIQFDADHAPEEDYASNVMHHFNDSKVGYVATPSIVDGNLNSSWTVRARNYWESTNHGPIQSGCNDGFAPMMFGSHYAHRTKALKSIGGIAPEIAEDLTTTLTYNANGWKGAFAGDAIAHGYGPIGLEDSMVQEYQWAMVGMRALFFVTSKLFWDLPWQVKIQFLVWHTWYPLVTFVTLISCLLPAYALLMTDPIISVEGSKFVLFYGVINFSFLLYVLSLRFKNILRPIKSWHLTWETIIFQLMQWPWILIGTIEGFIQGIMNVPFYKAKGMVKITDKSEGVRYLPWTFLLPHYLIILINALAIITSPISSLVFGYYWFSFVIVFTYSISILISLVLNFGENLNKLDNIQKLKYAINHLPTIGISVNSIGLMFYCLSYLIYNFV